MYIAECTRNEITVLTVIGGVKSRQDILPLYERIHALTADEPCDIVIDLSRIALCSAALLGALAYSLKTVKSKGGYLRVAGVSKQTSQALKMTNLLSILQPLRTVEKAIANIAESRMASEVLLEAHKQEDDSSSATFFLHYGIGGSIQGTQARR